MNPVIPTRGRARRCPIQRVTIPTQACLTRPSTSTILSSDSQQQHVTTKIQRPESNPNYLVSKQSLVQKVYKN